MTIKKTYFKTKNTCKVNFRLPKEIAQEAESVNLVGEFNNWSPQTTPLKKLKNGSFTVDLELEKDRDYQFRYLIDKDTWLNDDAADSYAPSPFEDAENSVVRT